MDPRFVELARGLVVPHDDFDLPPFLVHLVDKRRIVFGRDELSVADVADGRPLDRNVPPVIVAAANVFADGWKGMVVVGREEP